MSLSSVPILLLIFAFLQPLPTTAPALQSLISEPSSNAKSHAGPSLLITSRFLVYWELLHPAVIRNASQRVHHCSGNT